MERTAEKKASIEVTEKAVASIKRLMEKEGKANQVVRVGVRGGGCSGLSYVLQFEGKDRVNPLMDQVFDFDGAQIVIDKKSLIYLAGTTLDFDDGLMGKGFTFKNPSARQSCGCGESFSA